MEECLQVFNGGPNGVQELNNEEVILLAQHGKIAAYALEKVLGDLERAVLIRRALICKPSSTIVERGTDLRIYLAPVSTGLDHQDA